MKRKDLMVTVKMVIVVAIILCGIAQILPWVVFSVPTGSYIGGIDAGMDFYSWGSHVHISPAMGYSDGGYPYSEYTYTSADQWLILYLLPMGHIQTSTYGFDISTFESEVQFVGVALLILSFILCIIVLFLGLAALKKHEKSNASLYAGISSLAAIIFFGFGMNLLLSQLYINPTASIISSYFSWSYGLYLMIASTIVFFVAYGIQFAITVTPSTSMTHYPTKRVPSTDIRENMVTSQTQPNDSENINFCTECGTRLEGNPSFCPECGNKII